MTEIHALSGAYAVDALDDDERADFEAHLSGCADCRAEVDSLREAAALLGDLVVAGPPPSLREGVLADIATVRPLPPVTRLGDRRRWSGHRRFRPALLVAAAAVIVAGVGTAVVQPWDGDDTVTTQPTAADRVLQAADAEPHLVDLGDGVTATVVHSASQDRAVLVTENMPPPPPGKVYEAWFQNARGEMISAGVMPDERSQTVLLKGDADNAVGVGITIEPDGGSTSPTGDPIVYFPLKDV